MECFVRDDKVTLEEDVMKGVFEDKFTLMGVFVGIFTCWILLIEVAIVGALMHVSEGIKNLDGAGNSIVNAKL